MVNFKGIECCSTTKQVVTVEAIDKATMLTAGRAQLDIFEKGFGYIEGLEVAPGYNYYPIAYQLIQHIIKEFGESTTLLMMPNPNRISLTLFLAEVGFKPQEATGYMSRLPLSVQPESVCDMQII